MGNIFAKELGRLANGVESRMPSGSNSTAFILKHMVPKHKRPTYDRLVCNIRQHKADTYRSRLTVGGNLISYEGDRSTATADLATIKCHLNSTISNRSALFCTMDIKKSTLAPPYLNTNISSYSWI